MILLRVIPRELIPVSYASNIKLSFGSFQIQVNEIGDSNSSNANMGDAVKVNLAYF